MGLLVDNLLRYVEEQLNKGYKPEAVRQALEARGYSPAVVDNVIESVLMKQQQAQPATMPSPHKKKVLSKILIILLVLALGVLGIVFVPSMLSPGSALLDVSASPDQLSVAQGEEVGFELEIYNMGSAERFDINLLYRVLDNYDTIVASKEETIAISTSASHHRSISLPATLPEGDYRLKVFANYEGQVATSSFSFSIQGADEPVESCGDNIKNQDEVGVDCGGVCGGYWYDNACHSSPEQEPDEPEPQEPSCNDGIKNQNEVGVDCGGVCGGYWYDNACHSSPEQEPDEPEPSAAAVIIDARHTARTNPEAAKQLCFELSGINKDKCLKEVASASMQKEICKLISNTDEKDLCYYPFFMSGDYTVCEELVDSQTRESCEQLREISQVAAELNQTAS